MRTLVLSLLGLVLSASAVFADIASARNFYQYSDGVLTSGQPSEQQLETAAADGIEVVINIVPQSESIYNPQEGAILQSQGIEYIHVPVNWRSPKPTEIEAFLAAMDSVGDRKVLVHCWANARASALVSTYRISQAPETRTAELETLDQVWSDVAGYDLETNTVWQSVIDTYSVAN